MIYGSADEVTRGGCHAGRGKQHELATTRMDLYTLSNVVT